MRYSFAFETDVGPAIEPVEVELYDENRLPIQARNSFAIVLKDEIANGVRRASLVVRNEHGGEVYQAELAIFERRPAKIPRIVREVAPALDGAGAEPRL